MHLGVRLLIWTDLSFDKYLGIRKGGLVFFYGVNIWLGKFGFDVSLLIKMVRWRVFKHFPFVY